MNELIKMMIKDLEAKDLAGLYIYLLSKGKDAFLREVIHEIELEMQERDEFHV